MNFENDMIKMGIKFFDYFTQSYSYKDFSDKKICFFLEDETFLSIANDALKRSCDEQSIKEIFKSYSKIYGLNYSGNRYIATALAVYQVKCCTTAEALDEASIIKAIADGYDTKINIISQKYFISGYQKRLWDYLNKQFGGKLMFPQTIIAPGKTGCNVQYPKEHRIYTRIELTKCKKQLFPYMYDITDFKSFCSYRSSICGFLYRNYLDDSQLLVLYRLYTYWLKHQTSATGKSHSSRTYNTELRIAADNDIPSIIDDEGNLVFSGILHSNLKNDFRLFYYDEESYSTRKIESPDMMAVLINHDNPLFSDSLGIYTSSVHFMDNESDYKLIFYDEEKFCTSPFFEKSGIDRHDFFLKGGINLQRNEYVTGFLPSVECLKDSMNLEITSIGNSGISSTVTAINHRYDLNDLSEFLMNSGYVKFRISSGSSSRTFSIITRKEEFHGNTGWEYEQLRPLGKED